MSPRPGDFITTTILICLPVCLVHGEVHRGNLQDTAGLLVRISAKFQEYKVVLEPDKDQAEWWAGAPSVVRDKEGTFRLACRMRTADSPRGLHGYEIRILRSADGEQWEPVGSPRQSIMDLTGWHGFYVRPACVVPVGVGYLFIYEGSNCDWFDPVYNIATGAGFTFDLHQATDLTPDGPLVVSTAPASISGPGDTRTGCGLATSFGRTPRSPNPMSRTKSASFACRGEPWTVAGCLPQTLL